MGNSLARGSMGAAYLLVAHLVAAGCGELAQDVQGDGGGIDGGGIDGGASDDGGVRSDGARGEAGSADGATAPRCGDGVVTAPDACDDKNNAAGDGCDATCHVEPGWSCSGSPSVCEPVCGDGVVTGSEMCDDGNTDDGDACPSTCHRELWSKRYGDASNQSSIGVAIDTTGDAVISGTYLGSVDFGGGPLPSAGSDVFIAKVDAAGNHVWSRRAGALKQDDRGTGVAIDAAHDVVVTGVFMGAIDFGGGPLVSSGSWDIFVVKLDAAGNHLWSKRFGDSAQQQTAAVSVDAAGNIVITGTFWGNVDFGGGPLTAAGKGDIFVAKLDTNGNHVWSRRFGDGAYQGASSVAVSGAGDVYVTGVVAGTVDFGAGPIAPVGEADALLLALDVAGQHRWSRRWGASNDYQGGTGVAVGPAGDVLVTGYCQGPLDLGTGVLTGYGYLDVFLGKFSPAGVPIFGRRIGSNQKDEPSAVATDGSGNILLTGYYQGPIDFGGGPLTHVLSENAFVAKLDPSGAHIWSRGYGTSARGLGIAADPVGHVFAAGTFWNSITFGATTHTSAGGDDFFLAKLAP